MVTLRQQETRMEEEFMKGLEHLAKDDIWT